MRDVVFATLVSAHGNTFLRERSVLLDVPNLKNPVRVDCVNATTTLVNNHVDDVVMFQRWSCAQTNWRQRFVSRNIILLKLVLGVKIHNLTESTERLKRLSTDSCCLELELHQERINIFGHGPIFVLCLYFPANLQTFTVAISFSDDRIQYLVLDEHTHFSFLSSASFGCFRISDRFDDLSDFVLNSKLIFSAFPLILSSFQLFLFKLLLSWLCGFCRSGFVRGSFLCRTLLSFLAAQMIDSFADLLQFTFASQLFNVLLCQELSPPSLNFNDLLGCISEVDLLDGG